MYKILLISLLTIFSNLALADFEEFMQFDTATIFIDRADIERNENHASMWIMIDYHQAQPDKTGKSVFSDQLKYQFDCPAKQYSIVASTAYSDHMATGEKVSIDPDKPVLTPVAPNTMDEDFWKIACGK